MNNDDWLNLSLSLIKFYNSRVTELEQKGYAVDYMSDTQLWNASQEEFKDDLLKYATLLIRKCDKEMLYNESKEL